MHISITDGSNYFRGLLLLVSKDRRIARPETELLLRIGHSLGFEHEFCETAIHEVLENTYLPTDPPAFSTRELAEKFIRDGLAVATADHDLHEEEEAWLRACAETNHIPLVWYAGEVARAAARPRVTVGQLEVEALKMR